MRKVIFVNSIHINPRELILCDNAYTAYFWYVVYHLHIIKLDIIEITYIQATCKLQTHYSLAPSLHVLSHIKFINGESIIGWILFIWQQQQCYIDCNYFVWRLCIFIYTMFIYFLSIPYTVKPHINFHAPLVCDLVIKVLFVMHGTLLRNLCMFGFNIFLRIKWGLGCQHDMHWYLFSMMLM